MDVLVAGGVAGLITDVTLFPLDTLKTRLQQGCCTNGHVNFQGLYRGLGPAALASAPAAAIFFTSYDFIKRKNYVEDTPWGHGKAAAASELAACAFKVPFEVAKQRLQVIAKTEKKVSAYSVLSKIYALEGVRGCYAGFWATLAREVPFGFIQMPVYEYTKQFILLNRRTSENSSLGKLTGPEACGCGAVAGGLAAAVTCPLDVWKTRLMLGQKNSSIFSIAKTEGIPALFSGLIPRVTWISLGGSLFFGVYEVIRNFIHPI